MELGHSPFHISNSRWRIRSEVLLRSIRDVIIGYTTIQSGSKVQRFQWDGYDTIYDWRADGAHGSQLSALHQIERTRSASQDGDGQPVRERFPERKPGPLLTGNPAPTAFSPARRKSRHRSSSSPPDAATTTAKPATEWHDPHLIAIPAVLRESRYGASPKLFLLVGVPDEACQIGSIIHTQHVNGTKTATIGWQVVDPHTTSRNLPRWQVIAVETVRPR
ncbi:MAG TPA: hypothetical protein VN767_13810 [Streptosporangiaceae bacterium]|nr:hypothetical protein [Streptosporangiaceae bacterium]